MEKPLLKITFNEPMLLELSIDYSFVYCNHIVTDGAISSTNLWGFTCYVFKDYIRIFVNSEIKSIEFINPNEL